MTGVVVRAGCQIGLEELAELKGNKQIDNKYPMRARISTLVGDFTVRLSIESMFFSSLTKQVLAAGTTNGFRIKGSDMLVENATADQIKNLVVSYKNGESMWQVLRLEDVIYV